MQTQPASGSDSRIAHWAAANNQAGRPADFAARLDGAQVSAELLEIFRETPEFGRSLAMRLDPFLDEQSSGSLLLVGGGGEAIVFGDDRRQHVIKLFAPPCRAAFGWVLERQANGRWGIRGGSIAEAVRRFSWLEECFASGLDLDQAGTGGEFLALRQPFILGSHPDVSTLEAWMKDQSWTRWAPPTDLAMIQNQTWRRDDFIATDVRPENALMADSDGSIRAIDFIVGKVL